MSKRKRYCKLMKVAHIKLRDAQSKVYAFSCRDVQNQMAGTRRLFMWFMFDNLITKLKYDAPLRDKLHIIANKNKTYQLRDTEGNVIGAVYALTLNKIIYATIHDASVLAKKYTSTQLLLDVGEEDEEAYFVFDGKYEPTPEEISAGESVGKYLKPVPGLKPFTRTSRHDLLNPGILVMIAFTYTHSQIH